MSQITFNPNGGDLGRAEFKYVTPHEFRVIVPHIAHILECLYISEVSKLPFVYAFEFLFSYKNEISFIMETIKLPGHVKFYEIGSNQIFEIRGISGGVTANLICYLVTLERKQ